MKTITDNVYHFLVAKGITYSMFIGEEPAKPDNLVSFAASGGGLPGLYLEKGKATGDVITEIPMRQVIHIARSQTGPGYDVIYLRPIMERSCVP